MIYLKDYLSEKRILFLEPATKMEALTKLVDASMDSEYIRIPDVFRKAVMQREAIIPTGIGLNVAIPHVKTNSAKKFFITIGIFPNGVEWESIDGKPVKLAFLIGGPDNHEQYLQILAKLTLIIRNDSRRTALMEAADAAEVLSQFEKI